MPIAPLSEEQLKEERKREEDERKWYAEENSKTRDFQLELEKVKQRTERERIKEQKRYIHAITILRLCNKRIPKVFLDHLN